MPMGFPKKMEGVTASAPASGGGGGGGGGGGAGGAPGFPKMFPSAPPRKDAEPRSAPGSAGSDAASVTAAAPKEVPVAMPQKAEAEAAKPAKGAEIPSDLAAQPALRRLLGEVRRGLEQTVEKEMKRVENEFGSIVQALSVQLLEARSEADRLREEERGLREANEEMAKKVKVLRELQERLKDV